MSILPFANFGYFVNNWIFNTNLNSCFVIPNVKKVQTTHFDHKSQSSEVMHKFVNFTEIFFVYQNKKYLTWHGIEKLLNSENSLHC